jgi:hypothetical protein
MIAPKACLRQIIELLSRRDAFGKYVVTCQAMGNGRGRLTSDDLLVRKCYLCCIPDGTVHTQTLFHTLSAPRPSLLPPCFPQETLYSFFFDFGDIGKAVFFQDSLGGDIIDGRKGSYFF